MNDPYKVLHINENASKDEIKKAYKNLVKKYHPDRYNDNPLKDLAEEKMREINEAYDYLMKNGNNNSNIYESIRMDIKNNNFNYAEQKLNNVTTKNAEWNFLMGIVHMQKGWYDTAYNYINNACNLDPSNMEYRQTFHRINNMNNSYRQAYYNNRGGNDKNLCDICTTLYCMDCCCECLGGDLISCC